MIPILAPSHTFVEIDHEIISTTIHPTLAYSRRVVVNYKRKYVHEVLVKETKSATMNIFQKKYFLFKSFVKAELS